MSFALIAILLVLAFGFVILFGAPYLPTLRKTADTALDLLDLKPGQTLLELGCGDGRVAKRAAARDLKVIAYELNPILVLIARLNTFRYKRSVKVIWGNYWAANWPEAEGIFVFLLERYMKKLDEKIVQRYKGQSIKLASYAFQVPGKKTIREEAGIYLYHYRLKSSK